MELRVKETLQVERRKQSRYWFGTWKERTN